MSRTIEQVQNDYGQAAAKLGDLNYKKQLTEDNLENLEYEMRKLLNNMQSLAKEAKAIAEAGAAVNLPEVKEEPQDEKGN